MQTQFVQMSTAHDGDQKICDSDSGVNIKANELIQDD